MKKLVITADSPISIIRGVVKELREVRGLSPEEFKQHWNYYAVRLKDIYDIPYDDLDEVMYAIWVFLNDT